MSKPDWSEWRLIPWVQGWQAAALSLDIDPHAMSQHSWMDGPGGNPIFEDRTFPSKEIELQFDSRLRVLNANWEFFTAGAVIMGMGRSFSEVMLSELAAWASSPAVGWEIPQELAILAKAVDVATSTGANTSNRIWTADKCAALLEEHNELKAKRHKSPTKELSKKYKKSETRIRGLINQAKDKARK